MFRLRQNCRARLACGVADFLTTTSKSAPFEARDVRRSNQFLALVLIFVEEFGIGPWYNARIPENSLMADLSQKSIPPNPDSAATKITHYREILSFQLCMILCGFYDLANCTDHDIRTVHHHVVTSMRGNQLLAI